MTTTDVKVPIIDEHTELVVPLIWTESFSIFQLSLF